MRIALTGGSGAIGQLLAHHLTGAGHQLLSLDIVPCGRLPCPEQVMSLTDYAATYAAFEGCDAVVHFGSIPYPDEDHVAAADRFGNNTVATFNVFNAALARGIRRIVWASSETVFGFPFQHNAPARVPVTEADTAPQTAYAMSKLVCEDLARMLCRLHGDLTIIGLRLSNILYAEGVGPAVDENGPPNRLRDTYRRVPDYWPDASSRVFNLWDYIDARDVCNAVDRALVAPLSGAHACTIVADDTLMNRPTRELVAECFPATPVDPSHGEFQAVVSNAYARELLDWRPQWSWRDVPETAAALDKVGA